MKLKDQRTASQRLSHTVLVGGAERIRTIKGLSEPPSYAFWACRPEHAQTVKDWVRNTNHLRTAEMTRTGYMAPSYAMRCQIHVVEHGHPALFTEASDD